MQDLFGEGVIDYVDASTVVDDIFNGSPAWQVQTLYAQADPGAFFPEKSGSTRETKVVCVQCEVRKQCLEYALTNDECFGIWGGLSERERHRFKRRVSQMKPRPGLEIQDGIS